MILLAAVSHRTEVQVFLSQPQFVTYILPTCTDSALAWASRMIRFLEKKTPAHVIGTQLYPKYCNQIPAWTVHARLAETTMAA